MTETIQVGILTAASAIIAGLGGVALQLWHAGRQRERERVLNLRHQVFLEFADGAAKPIQYLIDLPNIDKPLSELAPLATSTLAASNRLHGVAQLQTLEAFTKAQECFGEITLALLPKRFELDKLTAHINASDVRRDDLLKQIQQRTTQLQSTSDQAHARVLIETNKQSLAELDELDNQHRPLILARIQKQIALTVDCVRAAGDYAQCLYRLNAEMRKEMELPLGDEYEQIMMQTQKKMQALHLKFAENLRVEMKRLFTPKHDNEQ
jgi:hypothetical protein